MRVLLIEDEPTTAKAIELMLTTEGFNVYSTDLGEEGLMRDLPEVPAVDRHRALLRIIGPRNQGKERALARSAAAHQRDAVADRNAEGHVIEVALLAAVAEADAVEADLFGQAGRGHRMRGVADVDRRIE